jgi:uncharacterized protein VirK/YbjX
LASLSQRVGISYDALWRELSGAEQARSAQHWVLPLHWEPRPEGEVASSKRSQLRRRNQMRQQAPDASLAGRAAATGIKKPRVLRLGVKSSF